MRFDALIVGGSYAGLSAALQLARAGRDVCVVDSGQPRNRFADASHGVFGWDGAKPADMISRAREQVLAYPTVTFVAGEVVSAGRDGDRFAVRLAAGDGLAAERLLLAHGVEDGLPELAGMEERWGASVLHCPYCHGYEHAGGRLGVLHAMPASLHQALLIRDWGPTTYFLNGADLPDAEGLTQLRARGVAVEQAPIAALEGDAPALSGVRLADGRSVPLDALFIAPAVRLGPLAGALGCELDAGPTGPYVRTDDLKQTTVPGVYAAGDVARPFANASLAAADGVIAGAAMHQSLIFAGLN